MMLNQRLGNVEYTACMLTEHAKVTDTLSFPLTLDHDRVHGGQLRNSRAKFLEFLHAEVLPVKPRDLTSPPIGKCALMAYTQSLKKVIIPLKLLDSALFQFWSGY